MNRSVRRDALEGYRHALEEFRLPYRSEYVIIGKDEVASSNLAISSRQSPL